jgi:uncharacterized protein with PQ loop repeat
MSNTSSNTAQLIGTAATAYGVIAALTVLLQARQMLARRASCEVSGKFLATYVGGYGIWLLYGLSVGSMPLIVVDAVGLLCGGLTLVVALSLRGSLVRPTTWTSCNAIPVSEDGVDLVPSAIPNAARTDAPRIRDRRTERRTSNPRVGGSNPPGRMPRRPADPVPSRVGVQEVPSLPPRLWTSLPRGSASRGTPGLPPSGVENTID